ncbi:expressed unknown protein [Seminavis robusta]|uniref:Uncharacterized protein n=1 Tax=Seminavis robusta TaxID=568900 RepID=A0A9N8H990_9STRA|nr:expressed unknown protein [Seminavis robusta]|eukprot:Sro197_g083861.1  (131) ;mRNA; r:66353-66745
MNTPASPANLTSSNAMLEQKRARLQGRINRARSSHMRRGSSCRGLTTDKRTTKRQLPVKQNHLEDSFASLHPNEILDLLVVSANEDPNNSFRCLQTIKHTTFDKPRRSRSSRELRGSLSDKAVPSSVEIC